MAPLPDTILVIDDSPEDRAVIRRYLERDPECAYAILEAETGLTGLRLCRSESLSCVLLDYCLPDLDGLEFLAELKALPASLPVVMITGYGDEDVAVQALKAGANDYLVKGRLSADLLRRTLANTIEKTALLERLKQQQHELEQMLLAEQEARSLAEQAVQVRNQFFTVAAHELRAPITVLSGSVQLLLRRLEREGRLTPRDQESLNSIVTQAQRLTKMVARLFDVSLIEMGKLAVLRRRMDLCALLRRLVAELEPGLDQHWLQVEGLEASLEVHGDHERLEQVFHNLLQNAVKYSPDGGPIRLRVWAQGATVAVEVCDEGIGIPAEDQPLLFRPFFRAGSSASRPIAGAGIGLYVVHELVRLHGGSVRVSSVEGAGSSFTVLLPLAGLVEPE